MQYKNLLFATDFFIYRNPLREQRIFYFYVLQHTCFVTDRLSEMTFLDFCEFPKQFPKACRKNLF